MKEETKRNGRIRNENDLKFLPDINPPLGAAVKSRRRFLKDMKSVYKTGLGLSTTVEFLYQHQFSDLVG
jgi:hypothetical protein